MSKMTKAGHPAGTASKARRRTMSKKTGKGDIGRKGRMSRKTKSRHPIGTGSKERKRTTSKKTNQGQLRCGMGCCLGYFGACFGSSLVGGPGL